MIVWVWLLGELSAVDEQSDARDEAGPGAIDTPMVADTAAKGEPTAPMPPHRHRSPCLG
jgi:hypothetical protein